MHTEAIFHVKIKLLLWNPMQNNDYIYIIVILYSVI